MNKFLMSMLAFAMVATAAMAQTSSTNNNNDPNTVSGVVVSMNDSTLVVRTSDGTEQTYIVTSTADRVKFNALTAGEHVMVTRDTAYPNRVTDVTITSPSSAADNRMASNEQLPRTASPLPLIGLLGLIALAAGLGLRAASKRTA